MKGLSLRIHILVYSRVVFEEIGDNVHAVNDIADDREK